LLAAYDDAIDSEEPSAKWERLHAAFLELRSIVAKARDL